MDTLVIDASCSMSASGLAISIVGYVSDLEIPSNKSASQIILDLQPFAFLDTFTNPLYDVLPPFTDILLDKIFDVVFDAE